MADDGVEPRGPVNEGSQTSTTIVGVLRFSIDSHYQQTKFFGSRQATISVDAMLEVLQRSAEEKEKKLEEEDEALIKSLFGVVHSIDDDILYDDEDSSQISTDNAETSNNNSKIFPEWQFASCGIQVYEDCDLLLFLLPTEES
ncbi:hypothetical protein ACSBR2_005565 [Camellia fascicularis]